MMLFREHMNYRSCAAEVSLPNVCKEQVPFPDCLTGPNDAYELALPWLCNLPASAPLAPAMHD